MNHEKDCDSRLNKKLHELLGLVPSEIDIAAESMVSGIRESNYIMRMAFPSDSAYYGVDYCNNWSDIGPLIEEHMISIEYHGYGSNKRAFGYADCGMRECLHSNPKRAAAICIIKLLESENAQ